jgi:ketosteroid isomerase-like protein
MCRLQYILLLVSVIWPRLAPAADQQAPEAATVRALELKWAEAYKLRQFDVLSSFLDDDCVSTFEDGSVFGKLGVISYISQNPLCTSKSPNISDLKIRMHGLTAVVTGAYHEQGVNDGKRYDYHDRFTDVWTKVRGNWKLIASHYSIPAQ